MPGTSQRKGTNLLRPLECLLRIGRVSATFDLDRVKNPLLHEAVAKLASSEGVCEVTDQAYGQLDESFGPLVISQRSLKEFQD